MFVLFINDLTIITDYFALNAVAAPPRLSILLLHHHNISLFKVIMVVVIYGGSLCIMAYNVWLGLGTDT